MENDTNCPKFHNLNNLVFIAEAKKTISKNSGVINVCIFLHVDFESVELYVARQYVNFTKEGKYEDFFFKKEEEK